MKILLEEKKQKTYLFISELLAANSAFFLLRSINFDSLALTVKFNSTIF